MEHDEPMSHLVSLFLGGGIPGVTSLGVLTWYVRQRVKQIDQLRRMERRAAKWQTLCKQVVEQVVAEQNRQGQNIHALRNWCVQLGFGQKPEYPPDWEPGKLMMPRLPNGDEDEEDTDA